MAPTAANLQPVKLLVVQDKERLKSIAKAGNIYNAPLAPLSLGEVGFFGLAAAPAV